VNYKTNPLEKVYIWFAVWSTFFKKEIAFNGYLVTPKKISFWIKGFHSKRPIRYDFNKWGYNAFVSDLEMIKLTYINYPFSKLLRNKMVFSNYFRKYFNTPENYFLVSSGKIKQININYNFTEIDDVLKFLEIMNSIILKPVYGSRGCGIYLLEKQDDSNYLLNKKSKTKSEVLIFINTLKDYLGCEFIKQGSFANNFFKMTTNTIRITTIYNDKKNSAFIPYALMRFGRSKTIPADNSAIGGLMSMIDLETGVLTPAVEFDKKGEPHYNDIHPETGEQINGIKIPNWIDLVSKFITVAEIIGPIIKIVGWDIVLRENDYVVIEGNNGPDLFFQGISIPLAKNENVLDFLKYYKIR